MSERGAQATPAAPEPTRQHWHTTASLDGLPPLPCIVRVRNAAGVRNGKPAVHLSGVSLPAALPKATHLKPGSKTAAPVCPVL
jgi:hypothetical protein